MTTSDEETTLQKELRQTQDRLLILETVTANVQKGIDHILTKLNDMCAGKMLVCVEESARVTANEVNLKQFEHLLNEHQSFKERLDREHEALKVTVENNSKRMTGLYVLCGGLTVTVLGAIIVAAIKYFTG
jgi:hypothetical protein